MIYCHIAGDEKTHKQQKVYFWGKIKNKIKCKQNGNVLSQKCGFIKVKVNFIFEFRRI